MDVTADMEKPETGESARRNGRYPTPQEPSLDKLPLELLSKIVSLLPLTQQLGIRRVSHRWLEAVDFHLKTLRKLHIDYPEELDDTKLEFLLTKVPELRSLTSRTESFEERHGFIAKTQLSLSIVLKCCPHLEEADFCWFRLDTELLRQLGSACPQLRALKMPRETDDAGLQELLPHLTTLRSLDLSDTAIIGACFSLLPASLERLDLSFTNVQWSAHFRDLARCPQLRDLYVLGVSNELRDADLAAVVAGCPRLERLKLLYTFKESGWVSQLSHCPQLREIQLSSSTYDVWYSGEDFAVVLIACSRLERLSLTGCKLHGSTWLRQLSQCPQLRELELSRALNIRAADLAEGLACCPMLERLTLDSLRDVDGGPLLLQRCLPPPGGLPALRHLSLVCILITDSCLERLSRLLPDLHTLQVTTNRNVSPTEEGWMACLPRLRQLQALNLKCQAVGASDSLLGRLHDLPLRKLWCQVSDHFTPGGISHLVSASPSLKYLHLADKEAEFWRQLAQQLTADRDVTIAVAERLIGLPLPPARSIRLVGSSKVRFEDV